MRISRSEYGAPERVIDLNGPAGNGLNIIATAVSFERQLQDYGVPGYDADTLREIMYQSTWEENVNLLEERFGDYITIIDVDEPEEMTEEEIDAEWDEYWMELDNERDND